jgi:hypothetical protein
MRYSLYHSNALILEIYFSDSGIEKKSNIFLIDEKSDEAS